MQSSLLSASRMARAAKNWAAASTKSCDKRVHRRKSQPTVEDKKHKTKKTNEQARSSSVKRPLHAYNFFFREQRTRLLNLDDSTEKLRQDCKEKAAPFSFLELTNIIKKRWLTIDETTKKKYLELAREDEKRYRRETKSHKMQLFQKCKEAREERLLARMKTHKQKGAEDESPTLHNGFCRIVETDTNKRISTNNLLNTSNPKLKFCKKQDIPVHSSSSKGETTGVKRLTLEDICLGFPNVLSERKSISSRNGDTSYGAYSDNYERAENTHSSPSENPRFSDEGTNFEIAAPRWCNKAGGNKRSNHHDGAVGNPFTREPSTDPALETPLDKIEYDKKIYFKTQPNVPTISKKCLSNQQRSSLICGPRRDNNFHQTGVRIVRMEKSGHIRYGRCWTKAFVGGRKHRGIQVSRIHLRLGHERNKCPHNSEFDDDGMRCRPAKKRTNVKQFSLEQQRLVLQEAWYVLYKEVRAEHRFNIKP